MALSVMKSRAQQVRDEYRTARVKRLVELKQAEVLLPPGFPPDAIVDPSDGTLNKDVLTADLPVEMAAWNDLPPTGQTSVALVEWARAVDGTPPDELIYQEVYNKPVTGPVDPADFPLILNVPRIQLAADGAYYLRLALLPYNAGPTLYSVPVPLICDSEGPYRHDAPFAMEVPTFQVTDAYLSANGDTLICGIPEYVDYQPGDKVAYYWGTLPPPDDPTGVVPIGFDDLDGSWPFPVEFSGDIIRLAGDGISYALYILVDKATNESKLSEYTPLIVALGTLPSGMQDPEVPLAVDGVVDLKDAMAGVDVQIPRFDNYKPTDTIEVSWGKTGLPGIPVGGGSFPLDLRVPSQVLKATYGTGVVGPVDTTVSYVVTRGGLPSTLLSTTVSVNFSIIGPPRPDPDPTWPDPVNPALVAAEIYGKTSDVLNELTREDEGQDVTVNMKLYGPLAAAEVISFYWNGIEVPEAQYTVLADDTVGQEISVEIPWTYVEQGFNNEQLPVHYRIKANENADNEQYSPNTLVKANAVNPKAPAPTFEGLVTAPGGAEFLNCQSLYDTTTPSPLDPAIRVKVPDLTKPPFNLAAGAVIHMSWRVVEGYDSEVPIDVDFDEDITLGVEYPPTGFIWRVQPYTDYILPVYAASQDGRGRVTYSFDFGGESVPSGQVEAFVAMHTGVGPCPITPRRKKE